MADNATIAREIQEAHGAGGVEAIIPFVHPDFEGVVPEEISAEPDTYRGHEGVRRYFALWSDAIDDLQFESLETFNAPEDKVVAISRLTGTGRGSGIPVDMLAFSVMEFADSKLIRQRGFASREEAFAAAGVEEPPER